MPDTSIAVALGVGASGALQDVSEFVHLLGEISYEWGRTDAFTDLDPGEFAFELDNFAGQFTPDNAATSFATPLTEGARACISVDGRLTAGTVRRVEPVFPGADSAWARVRVVCEDGFGDAARADVPDVTQGAAFGVGCAAFWPLDDSTRSAFFAGVTGQERALYLTGAASVTYEVEATVPGGPRQVTFAAAAASQGIVQPLSQPGVLWASDFGDGTACEHFGVWVTPRNQTSFLEIQVNLPAGGGFVFPMRFGVQNEAFAVFDGSTASYRFSAPFEVDRPYYLAVSAAGSFWVNGELVHSFGNVGFPGGSSIRLLVGDPSFGPTEVSVSSLHATRSRVRAEAILGAAGATMYELVAQTTGLTYAAAPSDLSESPVGVDQFSGSALEFLNFYLLTEQGDAYITTTGTLTSPTVTLTVRSRTRPAAVTASFNVLDDLEGAPEFVRDLTNLVSRVKVNGPTGTTVVDDAALRARAGRASDTSEVMLIEGRDRLAWGQDRLRRGGNIRMRIASVVIDAFTTRTDRNADLLSLKPGDRVRFTGLPDGVLGFTTWDGWFLGATEIRSVEAHTFEMHFTPVLADTAVYDTDRYVDDVLRLSSGINSSGTSMSIATVADKLTTTDLPLTVQVDAEQITITACTSATPQVATIARGVNGTTAAAHLTNAAVTVLPDSIYAF